MTEATKIDIFELYDVTDKSRYERLLNNENIKVLRDEFVYTKEGRPKIVVWYTEDIPDPPRPPKPVTEIPTW